MPRTKLFVFEYLKCCCITCKHEWTTSELWELSYPCPKCGDEAATYRCSELIEKQGNIQNKSREVSNE